MLTGCGITDPKTKEIWGDIVRDDGGDLEQVTLHLTLAKEKEEEDCLKFITGNTLFISTKKNRNLMILCRCV